MPKIEETLPGNFADYEYIWTRSSTTGLNRVTAKHRVTGAPSPISGYSQIQFDDGEYVIDLPSKTITRKGGAAPVTTAPTSDPIVGYILTSVHKSGMKNVIGTMPA